MNENIAPADLRYLIRATLTGTGAMNSLANVNTTNLPDGATCYVIQDGALWVLDKDSNAPAIADQILAPGSGPGRWYFMQSAAGLTPPLQVDGDASNSWTPDGNWGTSTTDNCEQVTGFPGFWAVNLLGTICTYSGRPATFLAEFSATFEIGNADAMRTVFAAISHNNDITGAGAVGLYRSSIDIGVVAQGLQVTARRLVKLVDGDTVRPKAAAAAAASTLVSTSQSLVLIPI